MNNIYEKWMNHCNVSDEVKTLMTKMDIKDIDFAFNDLAIKFGTAGYRAKIGPGNKFMNIYTYQNLAVGYAKFVKRRFYREKSNKNKRPIVVVGHDNRFHNSEFTRAVVNALTNCDVEVLLFDKNKIISTPIISYTIKNLKLDGGINITASHNPKNYNGFKTYNHKGSQLLSHECEMLTSLLPNDDENLSYNFPKKINMEGIVPNTIITSYLNDIKNNLIKHKNIPINNDPIIFTPHHGSGCTIVAEFLRSLGHNIIEVPEQSYIDEEFINSPNPNPEDMNSFKEASVLAKEKKSNVMFGLDPDGDRFAIAIRHNKKWRFLNGNENGILLTNYLLTFKNWEEKVPVIISTHVSNNLINEIAEHHQAIVLRTGVGFKFIGKAMDEIDEKDGKFCIGFEEAIGSCVNDTIREKDGTAAAALTLNMLDYYKNEGLDLIDVLEKRIYPIFGHWYGSTVSITIPGNNWKESAMKLEERAMNLRIKKVSNMEIEEIVWNEDGECIEWLMKDKSWIKFRISGTEPKFKIYFNLYFKSGEDFITFDAKKNIASKLLADIKNILKIV